MPQTDTDQVQSLADAAIAAIGGGDASSLAPGTSATAGAPPNDAADTAVAGAAARATYGVTGAGETVGIISDSFNAQGQAAANEAAGYLPNVTVLGDQAGTDEGQAMAELVHETAPGAKIVFDTFGSTLNSFAAAVTALRAAGATIIVDDVSDPGEPFFQTGDVLENAIESFVAAGGDYFTAAGNNGTAYYQGPFNGVVTTLPGMGTVTAENFGGGNALEPFTHTATGPLQIALQWNTSYNSARDSLSLLVYNSSNTLVAASTANVIGGNPVQYVSVPSLAAGTYKVAVVLNGGAAPGVFRYEFVEDTVDDSINDPNANTGGGNLFGHQLLANVNTVGADAVYATPAAGVNPPQVEQYSSTGPGELLLDSNGNPLSAPVFLGKVNFTAPDGSSTSVNGFSSFYGTSAAAPVAAATAALLLQANPGLTPAQVSAALAASADGMGGGPNVGAGLIQATAAVALADGAAGVGLVVDVAEDAWQGNAQFTVSVDGQQVGGVFTAEASHAAGQQEAFTVAPSLSAGAHTVQVSFTNDLYGGSAATDRNLYVTGASYGGAAVSGAAATLLGDSSDTFGVNVPGPGPAQPVAAASGAGLVIDVSEDAWQGDAQFVVTVDGQQVGGTYTATASHAGGQTQAVTIANTLANGSHSVGVTFINDAWAGSASTDRNLYVDGASYNGTPIAGAAAGLYVDGSDGFMVTVGGGATSTATLNMSEDAWMGDANFTVAVDGVQYGGIYTATASHAAGQSQAFTISGIPDNVTAHDIAISFINDAYGGTASTDRNLYVNGIALDGQAVPNAAATFFYSGTQHFAVPAASNLTG